jgi:hypothetical protein
VNFRYILIIISDMPVILHLSVLHVEYAYVRLFAEKKISAHGNLCESKRSKVKNEYKRKTAGRTEKKRGKAGLRAAAG